MTSVNKLGLSGKVDDLLSYSLAGEPKRLEHCFGAGFTKCREQNMLRSHSLGLQCPGLHCRLVYDPPAFFREGDLIVSFNAEEIVSRRDLYTRLWRHEPGERLNIEVMRDKKVCHFEVTGGDRAEFFKHR